MTDQTATTFDLYLAQIILYLNFDDSDLKFKNIF